MKKFTVLFSNQDHPKVGLIFEFSSDPNRLRGKDLLFKGWWGNSLKEVYNKYQHNKKGYWIGDGGIESAYGCSGWSDVENITTDMFYEITEKELKGLIKFEKLTGGI